MRKEPIIKGEGIEGEVEFEWETHTEGEFKA
jgi:hypothetical protein